MLTVVLTLWWKYVGLIGKVQDFEPDGGERVREEAGGACWIGVAPVPRYEG